MRPVLLSLPFLLVIAAPAVAQARPDSLRMSCAAAASLVKQNGSVVIGTGPNLYDLYVSDAGYCPTQRSEPAWIATLDQAECLVGQRCRERRPPRRR